MSAVVHNFSKETIFADAKLINKSKLNTLDDFKCYIYRIQINTIRESYR